MTRRKLTERVYELTSRVERLECNHPEIITKSYPWGPFDTCDIYECSRCHKIMTEEEYRECLERKLEKLKKTGRCPEKNL